MTLSGPSSDAAAPPRPVRVLIVDDSAIIRALIERILKTDPHITVCGFARNGQETLEALNACDPDIVVLDIEMPVMDGITALPRILEKKPKVKVLICSTLSDRGAAISIKALGLGAADCLLKPSSPTAISATGEFHQDLLRLVRHIGGAAIAAARAQADPHPPSPAPTPRADALPSRRTPAARPTPAPRPMPTRARRPKVLAIGCSTGGPAALGQILPTLKGLTVPIVVTQHMPKAFIRILAEHLATSSGMPCTEAGAGMSLEPGRAYFAPGGLHMGFTSGARGAAPAISLSDSPPENFCKPAVDPMLRGLLEVYGGPAILVAILTGMGEDGAKGCRAVADAGGRILVQDEATSVVWGMPGAVARAGLAHAILPLQEIAPAIRVACGGSQA